MPRHARVTVGGIVYHVINRANGRVRIFDEARDFQHFESLLCEGVELVDMRVLAYCIMPNHWHLVLYPREDGDLSEFMRWVTTTHVRQYRVATRSIGHGHLYQGAYKSFPIEEDKYLIDVIRYVEQNPLRAHLVQRAEAWQWSSLPRRERGNTEDKKLLAALPTELPVNYLESVNTLLRNDDLENVRHAVNKGTPYGSDAWVKRMVTRHHLQNTQRESGRPKKR